MLLNHPGASTTVSQREGRGIWGIKTTESSFRHLRPNTCLTAGIPQLPVLHPPQRWRGRGNEVQRQLTGCSRESRLVCRTRSCRLKGKAARQSPAARTTQTALAEDKSEGLSTGAEGQDGPFSLGKLVENGSAELWHGQEGREGTPIFCQRSAKSLRVWALVRVCCWSPHRTPGGAGRKRKAGRKGRSTRPPGCSWSCSAPFTTSGSSQR